MTLWQRIWQTGRRPVSRIRYALNLAGFSVLCLLAIGAGVMLHMDWQAVIRYSVPAPSRVSVPEDLAFIPEEVAFIGAKGDRLAGWYVPPRNGAVIILLHGYDGNRLRMRWQAERLAEAGYGVLMYDERGSGESGGKMRSYGWQDDEDAGGALAFLASRQDAEQARIGILGCSMGGQIALRAAARYETIAAVIADGPAIVTTVDEPAPHNWATAIYYLSGLNIDWMMSARTGLSIPPPMIDIIGKISPRPILLIGGGVDKPLVGSEERKIRRFAEFAGSNAEVWIIPEATHCDGPAVRPEEYSRRMIDFFDTALPPIKCRCSQRSIKNDGT